MSHMQINLGNALKHYSHIFTARLRSGQSHVFSRVCLSVCLSVHRGSHVTITHDALCLTTHLDEPLSMCAPIKAPMPVRNIHGVFILFSLYNTPGHVQTCATWTSMYRNPPTPAKTFARNLPGLPHTQLMSIFLTNTSIFVLQNINDDDENNVSMEYKGKKLALGHVYISLFYHSF